MVLQCMSGDERCLDDRELEQSMKVLTSLQVVSRLCLTDAVAFVEEVLI